MSRPRIDAIIVAIRSSKTGVEARQLADDQLNAIMALLKAQDKAIEELITANQEEKPWQSTILKEHA